jgi:hypothetical protein
MQRPMPALLAVLALLVGALASAEAIPAQATRCRVVRSS